jgi:hypothetical protein
MRVMAGSFATPLAMDDGAPRRFPAALRRSSPAQHGGGAVISLTFRPAVSSGLQAGPRDA